MADCQAKLEAKLQELRAVADAKQQVTTRPRFSPITALLHWSDPDYCSDEKPSGEGWLAVKVLGLF